MSGWSIIVFLCLGMTVGCAGVSGNGTQMSATAPTNASGQSSSTAQYVYVANGTSNVYGFEINSNGSLSALQGFPASTTIAASYFSAAKHTLLVGGSVNSSGAAEAVLYNINPASGMLTSESSTSANLWQGVLDPSAQFAYAVGGTSANVNATVSGYATVSGNFSPVPDSPYEFAIGEGSNPLIGQKLQMDPSGAFVYISATPEEEHTPAPWLGVAAVNNDGSLSGFASYSAGCISAADMATVLQSSKTLMYSSCIDQWNGEYWISAVLIDHATGGLTDLGAAWQDPTSTERITALAAEPSGTWLAGIDGNNNLVHVMAVNANGSLTDAPDHIFPTGIAPTALAFDRTGQFLYVINSGSNDMSAYAFDRTTGLLTPLAGSPFAMPEGSTSFVVAQP